MRSPKSILRKLRSLEYRLKLAEGIPELEQEIIALCRKYGTDVLCGYRIRIVEDRIVSLERLKESSGEQLEIDFRKGKRLEEKVERYLPDYSIYTVEVRVRRKKCRKDVYLCTPQDVYAFCRNLRHEAREVFLSISLDARLRVTGVDEVSRGTVNSTQVIPAEVFRLALLHNAPCLITVHNHPSGNPEPSKDDRHLTRLLAEIGEKLSIRLLDHVIIGDGVWVSLKERGIL